jgi:type II restriction enzyme
VEIPKSLLMESADAQLVIQTRSRQTPQPGYGYVYDAEGKLKYALYFDGGTERKLQIKAIRKELCIVHATWQFESAPFEQSIPS